MDAQELRNLQEAYMEVVMNEGLGGAPDPERQKRRLDDIEADIKKGEEMYASGKLPYQRQEKAQKAQEFLKKHPRKKRTRKEQVDLYDIILSHLLDEGYAETPEAAEAIMVNMSEEWRNSVIDSFIEEGYSIQETSLNRIRSKSRKGGMAILSGQRGDKSKKENKERSARTERRIRGARLPGPTKVSGRYTENPGTPQEKKVGEKSHVVSSGKMGKQRFKKTIKKLGTEGGLKHKRNMKGSSTDDQDSVLIQRKPGGSATLTGTSRQSWPGKGKNVKVGKMRPGRTGEFDTKVKNKTFTYEED